MFEKLHTVATDIDEQLLFNQQETALLIGISPQAFARWNVQPHRRGREGALYYWPDVRIEMELRHAQGRLRSRWVA